MTPCTESSLLKACRQAEACLYQAFKSESRADALIDQALSIYQDMLVSAPALADPYLGMAYLAFSAGRYDEALALLQLPESLGVWDMRLEQMKKRMTQLHSSRQAAPEVSAIQSIQKLSPLELDEAEGFLILDF